MNFTNLEDEYPKVLVVFIKILVSISYLILMVFQIITIAPILVMMIEENVYKDEKTLLQHQINMICGNYSFK